MHNKCSKSPVRQRSRPILIALLLVAFQIEASTAPQSSGHGAEAAEQPALAGYRIGQKSCYLAETEVQLCQAGIKILQKSNRNQVITLCPSPFDKIYVYSLRLKKVFVSPTAKYKNFLCNKLNFIAGNFYTNDNVGMRKTGTNLVFGRKCNVYTSSTAFARQQLMLYRQGECTFESYKTYKVFADETLMVSPTMAKAIYPIYGLPIAPGMPLAAKLTNVEDTVTEALQTTSLFKATFKAADFTCPSGFTAVKDERELSLDKRQTEDSIPLF